MSWVIHGEERARAAGVAEHDEVLYAVVVEDLVVAYEEERGEGSWAQLSEEQKSALIHQARKYMEGFCGEGPYNFADALKDAIKDGLGDEDEQGG